MNRFYDEVRSGVIYRKKTCDRCGAVDYEKLLVQEPGRNWQDDPKYELHGFGSVVMVPYDMEIVLTPIVLCGKCGKEFRELIDRFLRKEL